eukprot:gene5809-9632_t
MINEIELKEETNYTHEEKITFNEETRHSLESCDEPFIGDRQEHSIPEKPDLKKKVTQILKYLSMLIVGLSNLLYSATEILFSTKPFTGSLSLLGDGIHNLSDVLTLVVAFWAERTAKVKNSAEYTYGMQRAELIGGLINSIFLLSTAVFIIVEAIPKFFQPEKLEQSLSILIIAAVGVAMNLIATVIFGVFGCGHGHSHGPAGLGNHGHSHGGDEGHGHSHEIEKEQVHGHSHESNEEEHGHGHSHEIKKKKKWCGDANIAAVFLHFLGDTLSSVVVLITGILNYVFPNSRWVLYVDPICGLIIVGIILWTSIPLVNMISKILLQRVPEDVDVKKIQETILNEIDSVVEIHDFHAWQLIDSLCVCTMHIMMHEDDAKKFGEIQKKIHSILHNAGIHNSTIQPEYIKKDFDEFIKSRSGENLNSAYEQSCRCKKSCEETNCCSTSENSFIKQKEE